MTAEPLVEYNPATQTGSLCLRVWFERVLPKEAYEARLHYLRALGAPEGEARAYAGHLDHHKPSEAVEIMKALAPGVDVDWATMIAEAIRSKSCD